MLRAGDLIAGKYRVLEKLGEGAMGAVWLARNVVTDREFALKVLLPQAAQAPTALARFFQEARICGALRHPSILEIYDAGTAEELEGAPYLVMERLDGAPLDLLLRRRGALAPRLALDIVTEISKGLHLAHLKGIIHRDLKPANVFLHRPGTGAIEPKVLDFGISKITGLAPTAIALTKSATILGSPLYMSPEQMDPGRSLDARSDVHALGILLWECLTGTAPFVATSYNNLVIEIVKGPRPKLRDVMPSATSGMARIVENAFAIDVAHRYASAAELAYAVDVELASLGGGVLFVRTASAQVLDGLDAGSPLVPVQGSMPEALSVDRLGAFATQSAKPPSEHASGAGRGHEAFAQTDLALGVTQPAPRRARGPQLAAAAAVLAIIVTAALLAVRHAPAPTAPASGDVKPPPATVTPVSVPTTLAPVVSASASAPALPAAPAPALSASKPGHAPRPVKTPVAAASQAAPLVRPRIDQSGL